MCGPFDDDNVDRRLRFLTELVTSLRRRYDNAGIREWFLHAQVAERTPAEVLAGSWLPEDESVHRLRTAAPALR